MEFGIYEVENKEYGVSGLGFRNWGLGFGVSGLGFGVSGFGFRVWGLVFGVSNFRDLNITLVNST